MKTIQSLFVSAALAIGMAAPASAGVNSPEVIIYRFPGVTNSDPSGRATVFDCTNFSGVPEKVRFVTRTNGGDLLGNNVGTVNHLGTLTAATRTTNSYVSLLNILPFQATFQGTTAIAATSTNVICTAMVIDVSTVAPVGVALRDIRFSPVPGSEE